MISQYHNESTFTSWLSFLLFRPQQSSLRGWDAEAIVKITDNQIMHDVIRLSVVVMHQYCFFTNKQQISPHCCSMP